MIDGSRDDQNVLTGYRKGRESTDNVSRRRLNEGSDLIPNYRSQALVISFRR